MSNKKHEKQANELIVNAISKALGRANIPVVKSSDDLAEILQMAGEQVEFSKKKKVSETTSGFLGNHHPAAISDTLLTKVQNNIEKLIEKYEKNNIRRPDTLLGELADAFYVKNTHKPSKYKTIIPENGKTFVIRFSNHYATVSNFDSLKETDGLSIVVTSKENKRINNDGQAHIIEFYYNSIDLRKAYGQPLVEILQSLKEALLTGEYKDTTGLAQREEVNARFLKDKTGTIYGWTSNGKIYLTKDGLNPKTMIHEYTHLWSNAMMYGNPEGWQSIKNIMRQDPLWRDVKDDANYTDIADDEDMVVSEVLARRSEQNNSVLLERQSQKVLKEDSRDANYQAN